jgi:hypothetical protein
VFYTNSEKKRKKRKRKREAVPKSEIRLKEEREWRAKTKSLDFCFRYGTHVALL